MKKTALLILVLVLAASLAACGPREIKAPDLTETNFIIKVTFDTDVDVYNMLYDYAGIGGGVSYADGSPLNDVFYITFSEEDLADAPTLRGFFISIAPEIEGYELTPAVIAAEYGNMYYVTVTGTKETGYRVYQTANGD